MQKSNYIYKTAKWYKARYNIDSDCLWSCNHYTTKEHCRFMSKIVQFFLIWLIK